MRRKLDAASVAFLVVHDSNTTVRQNLTASDIQVYRMGLGYLDIGFHCVIRRDGEVSQGVPIDEAGTHTTRFDTKSVGILLVGGKTTRGRPSCNYTKPQLAALKATLVHLKPSFPNAAIVGAGELLGGTSPHFNVSDFYENTAG